MIAVTYRELVARDFKPLFPVERKKPSKWHPSHMYLEQHGIKIVMQKELTDGKYIILSAVDVEGRSYTTQDLSQWESDSDNFPNSLDSFLAFLNPENPSIQINQEATEAYASFSQPAKREAD